MLFSAHVAHDRPGFVVGPARLVLAFVGPAQPSVDCALGCLAPRTSDAVPVMRGSPTGGLCIHVFRCLEARAEILEHGAGLTGGFVLRSRSACKRAATGASIPRSSVSMTYRAPSRVGTICRNGIPRRARIRDGAKAGPCHGVAEHVVGREGLQTRFESRVEIHHVGAQN